MNFFRYHVLFNVGRAFGFVGMCLFYVHALVSEAGGYLIARNSTREMRDAYITKLLRKAASLRPPGTQDKPPTLDEFMDHLARSVPPDGPRH